MAADAQAGPLVEAVRRMAKGRVGEDWPADFDAMLAYAGSKGWLTDDRVGIQAHCEWHLPQPPKET
ncbi:hypothetical protein [Pseudonocardia sediminis]|nr:hypothetical protein [Pseudonocardia sediminis]